MKVLFAGTTHANSVLQKHSQALTSMAAASHDPIDITLPQKNRSTSGRRKYKPQTTNSLSNIMLYIVKIGFTRGLAQIETEE